MSVAVETTRIERLRRAFLRHRPEICIARAVLITESYTETEDYPAVLRRAHAFHRIMEKMPIYIEDDELIVGNIASRPRSAPIYPEYSAQWILDQMDAFATRGGDKLFIAEEDKAILREVLPCWVGSTVQDRIMRRLPAETKQAMDLGVFSSWNMITGGVGHLVPGYERVLQKGVSGIRAEIEAQLAGVDPSAALASRMAQETSDHRRRCGVVAGR